MKDIAYVNGVFGDLPDAKISIEDRGFQFADGVYEVIVAPNGRPFRLQQHLDRLKRSTDALDIRIDYAGLNLPAIMAEGIRLCGYPDVMIYVQVTRGVAARDHIYSDQMTPTVVATFKVRPVPNPEMRKRGVPLQTTPDIRWQRCSIKSIALLANVLLKNAARGEGYYEAVIVGPDGRVRETTTANIFIVRDSVLCTPPANDFILHGVTRAYVLECARDLGIRCDESGFTVAELKSAAEVFITSTTQDIMPVASIDRQEFPGERPGPVTRRLSERFLKGMEEACRSSRV